MANTKLVISEKSTQEEYNELFKLPVGSLFKVPIGDYETVMERIEQYKPEGVFEVFPVNPGTDLYTLNGPEHLVVTANELSTQE